MIGSRRISPAVTLAIWLVCLLLGFSPGNALVAEGQPSPDPPSPPEAFAPRALLTGLEDGSFRVQWEVDSAKIKGAPWALLLAWSGEETRCGFFLDPSIVSRRRGDESLIEGEHAGWVRPGDGRKTLRAEGEPGSTQWKLYRIKLVDSGAPPAMETLLLQFTRKPGNSNDTCDGPLAVTGILFDYEAPAEQSRSQQELMVWAQSTAAQRNLQQIEFSADNRPGGPKAPHKKK